MILSILEFICLLLQFTKAQQDSSVTDIQDYDNSSYVNASKAWHDWSAVTYIIFILTIGWLTHWIWVIPLALIRVVFFSPIYQIQRSEKKGIFYLSDKGWDGILTKYLGKNAGVIQFIAGVLVLIIINYLIFTFKL